MFARHWRIMLWPPALVLAAGALAWSLSEPGDTAYWVGGLLTVPALVLGAIEMEQRWPAMSRRTRALLIALSGACAAAGLLYALLSPGPRSNIVAGLLCLPVMTVLIPVLEKEDDDGYPTSTGGPWGPPPGV
jgi:peptidoglycan/LPS O-acetylase OafA/YrhL